ncbi:hypothetical protein GCM10010433_35820 [Streptomyces pulveraceus]
MEFPQLSATNEPEPILCDLSPVPLGDLLDYLCGYFEVTSHILCAKVNSVREHDKALDLVEDIDALHPLHAQRARFEQGDFCGHGHAFRS